jgi:UDP-3-O-[3-hydroxymyristoyl] glucosamine N-acyltransferase LpxD
VGKGKSTAKTISSSAEQGRVGSDRQVKVSHVVDFLARKSVVAGYPDSKLLRSEVYVENLSDLRVAGAGSLSWLSLRRFREDPSLVQHFAGSLLIAPEDALGERVLPCRDPKLAFSLAASFFLSAASNVEWTAGDSALSVLPVIASSARLARGVFLGSGVVIEDDVAVGPNTCLQHVTIGRGSSIGANCSIGGQGFGLVWSDDDNWVRFPHVGRVLIENGVEIGSNTCIDRGALGDTRIRSGARIDNLVHIAHNADIGEHALVIAHAMVAGSATIGARAWIAPNAAIMNQLTVGAGAIVGLGAVVVKSVEPGTTVVGNPAKPLPPRDPSKG